MSGNSDTRQRTTQPADDATNGRRTIALVLGSALVFALAPTVLIGTRTGQFVGLGNAALLLLFLGKFLARGDSWARWALVFWFGINAVQHGLTALGGLGASLLNDPVLPSFVFFGFAVLYVSIAAVLTLSTAIDEFIRRAKPEHR
ncbi:MAG: hypothetical protein ACRENP_08940 [Longimicrobiales bacterium]